MKKRILLIPVLSGVLGMTGCGFFGMGDYNKRKEESQQAEYASKEEETTTTAPEKKTEEVSLIACGDNLIHDTVYKKFYDEKNDTYDFVPLYENIAPTIKKYDLAVINQETIFVKDNADVSNYPAFGTPQVMGDALVTSGYDIVLSATNHTMDKGTKAIQGMAEYWKESYPQISLLGIHDSVEDYNTIDYVSKNGIKFAMFNYTYGLNGIELPEDKYYMVDLLDNKDKFLKDIQTAEGEADMTICFLHIGEEYTYEPTDDQVAYIEDVIDAGADVVICAHPHVIEPYGTVKTSKGNTGVVFYSCGNFVSGQDEIDRLLGGMATVNIRKTTEGDDSVTEVVDYDFIPVVTHYTRSEEAVYLLDDYTETLADEHLIKNSDNRFSVLFLKELFYDIAGKPFDETKEKSTTATTGSDEEEDEEDEDSA